MPMGKRPFEDDPDMITGCISRDPEAWSALVRKYSRLIDIAIDRRLKKYNFTLPREDMEDIRQNVLSSIWEGGKLESVRNPESLPYWLAITSGNHAMEYLSRERRITPPRAVSIYDKIGEKELSEILPSGKPGQDDELARNEISEKIDEAIGSLPEKEKLIIKLNILHGKKYNEIAGLLGLPNGTVSNYIKRAKGKLQKALKEFL